MTASPHRRFLPWMALAAVLAGCGPSPAPPAPGPDGVLSFAVFGDAPYNGEERARVEILLDDVNQAAPGFFLHVGDILGSPCTDEAYRDRLRLLQRLDAPVVYTPGDNEWTDCRGGFDPLERLTALRATFFEGPWAEDSRRRLSVVTQPEIDSLGAPFVENARFEVGSVVFATAHIVGSRNGMLTFRGRTADHDREVEERSAAALRWISAAFQRARTLASPLLVLAFHADPSFEATPAEQGVFAPILAHVADEATDFEGRVLLVHGDSHEQRLDRPLAHPVSGSSVENVVRLETWGAPDVGWLHVLVDTLAADPLTVRSYVCRGGILVHLRLRARPAHCALASEAKP